MSNFSALNTGLSALMAHRQAAEVIAHNIANVNTEGYTRRRVELQADGQAAVASVWSRGIDVGNGVHTEKITRVRDEFLETQYRNESGTGSFLAGSTAVLDRVEAAFPEPSDNGIAEQLNGFWAGWANVVNNPGSEAARTGVIEQGNMVVQAVSLADRQIRAVQADAMEHVHSLTDEVNSLATQVARYDQGIRAAVAVGQSPNDLLDQRDLLAGKLANLTGATIVPGEHETVDIYVGGRALVHGGVTEVLEVKDVEDPAMAGLGLKKVVVQWARDGYPAALTSGEVGGYVAGANVAAPKYLTQLNTVASQIVTSVNDLHTAGKDLDGATGRTFFDPAGTTAATMKISTDVAGQPRHLAAASATGGTLDTSVAQAIGAISRRTVGPDASYRSLITGLGSEVQFAGQQADMQSSLIQRLDEDRKSVSGVSLDEEMVNLVASQHAYSAAAKVISTIDEMLDTLINRMAP